MEHDYAKAMKTYERMKSKKELYEEKKANGLCVLCGEKLPDGYKYKSCENCRVDARERRARKVEAWKLAGLCHKCGSPIDTEPGQSKWSVSMECSKCRSKKTTDASKFENVQCIKCGRTFKKLKGEPAAACSDCKWHLRAMARAIAIQRSEQEEDIKRVEENILRHKGGIQAYAMRGHPCWGCVYAISIDDGRRLFLPHCGAGCLKKVR